MVVRLQLGGRSDNEEKLRDSLGKLSDEEDKRRTMAGYPGWAAAPSKSDLRKIDSWPRRSHRVSTL